MIGTNLACAEFGKTSGAYNKAYTYPGAKQLDYCRKKGLLVVRLPFKWERMQRELMGPLHETERKRLDHVVDLSRARGIKLLLDLHNYARYKGQLIGSPEVPNEAFADLWKKLAMHYKDEAAVFAYGIMNEPFNTKGLWPAAAQAAINAIRSVDRTHTLTVCGDAWGGAHSWKKHNKDLILTDPADNLLYEAHQYFDRDSSGSYKLSYDESDAYPDIGVDRLKPFADWLREHDARGFIGEFGVPDDDPRWLTVLDRFVLAMKKERMGGTYWASGPWWGKYPLSLEPRDGEDRPQMAVLAQYAGSRMEPSNKPWRAAAAKMEAGREKRAAERRRRKAAEARKAGTKVLFDFASRKESYHYSNKESRYESKWVDEGGRKARKVSYTHRGMPAWVGVGLYLGGLDCEGYAGFSLEIRSATPCRLEVNAYHKDQDRYSGTFKVGKEWSVLVIPFERLKRGDTAFGKGRGLLKVEFQPSPAPGGNSVLLREFKLVNGGG